MTPPPQHAAGAQEQLPWASHYLWLQGQPGLQSLQGWHCSVAGKGHLAGLGVLGWQRDINIYNQPATGQGSKKQRDERGTELLFTLQQHIGETS